MYSDLKFAFRQLAKFPGFTAVVVLTLALGIGSTTTVFCWLESIWLNPLPGVRDQSSMLVLAPSYGGSQWPCCSLPEIQDLRRQTDVFEGIVASQMTPACIKHDNRQEWIYGQITTANFFDVFGVQPLLGRTFLADEDQKPGGDPVLVLSETCWRKNFGGNPDVVGRTVEINRHPFTIVGIVPSAFFGSMSGLRCDFWAPLSMHREVANFGSLDVRTDRWLHTMVRVRPGVNRERAQAALDVASRQLEQAYPKSNTHISYRALTFSEAPYGVQAILLPPFRILLVVSFGVLLIVAANVANLLLARGSARQKEIAIRLAVGAGRGRLMRQLLVESVILAVLGGTGGVVFALWMLDVLPKMTPPSNLPIGLALSIDWRTLGFATVVAVSSGFIFGFMPAWQCTKPDLNSTLKEGGRGSGSGRGHQRLRQAFVVAEIAVSLVLLVGAGLCLRSTQKERQADFGFNPDHVLLVGLRIGMNGYDETSGKLFYKKLQEHLSTVPGVRQVALASWFPLGFEHNGNRFITPEGYQPSSGEDLLIPVVIVSPNYFATMETPILEGRDFNDADGPNAEPVAIVNEAMARRFWPGRSPLGLRFQDDGVWRTVIGVVKTGKYYAVQEPARPFYYRPYQQGVWDLNLGLALRTEGDPASYAQIVASEIHRLDPGVETWATLPLRVFMKAAFVAPVMASRLLSCMGFVALGLAAMGVYAVMAFAVNERMREFGLRMALGATPGGLLSLVLRNGAVLTTWGIGIGLVLAIIASRLLASLLYNVSPFDPLTFLGVPVILATTALFAALLPARKAMRADPCVTLRSE